jgi:hypothetical protein
VDIEGRRLVERPRGRCIDAVNKECEEYVTMQELEKISRG